MSKKQLTNYFAQATFTALLLISTALAANAPADLFEATSPPGNSNVQLPPQALQGRPVKVRMELLDQPSLTLNLFDDLEVIADKTSEVRNLQGRSVWLGEVRDHENSEVVLAVAGGVMMGSVRFDGQAFEVVYAGGSTHQVRQINLSHVLDDIVVEPDADADTSPDTTDSTATGETTTATAQDSGTVVDLMVVYTPAARSNAGGTAGMASKIANAVASANQAYQNSGVAMQLNLVHVAEIPFAESGDMSASLSALQSTGDGNMDEVHQWRNQYAADQVVLITTDTNACGIGYVMTSVSTGFAPYAFSVVHDDSVYYCLGNYTLAHELGHNQGNQHDRDSASFAGAYEYSYGYRLCLSGGFRTVMAYSCTGATRVGHFSNPDVLYGIEPTGTTGFEDNALSMNNTSAVVANWRVSQSVSVPAAPGNLIALAKGSDYVQLAWSDNSDNETGFRLQRSTAGGSWIDIATLGQNSTGYTDNGLAEGTLYQYRLYAYNSAGDSGLSNTLQVETDISLPSDSEAPVTAMNLADGDVVDGRVKISVSAADNVGVVSLALFIDGGQVAYAAGASLNHTWNTRKLSGPYTLEAVAEDAAGYRGSLSFTVTVGSSDSGGTDGGTTKKSPPGKNK